MLFRIPSRGYWSPLQEPSTILERLEMTYVIIINEISMMTSYMLCTVEHQLKQAARSQLPNALCNKLVLPVGDLAQRLAICIHSPISPDILCRCYHITFAPCWTAAKHHTAIVGTTCNRPHILTIFEHYKGMGAFGT